MVVHIYYPNHQECRDRKIATVIKIMKTLQDSKYMSDIKPAGCQVRLNREACTTESSSEMSQRLWTCSACGVFMDILGVGSRAKEKIHYRPHMLYIYGLNVGCNSFQIGFCCVVQGGLTFIVCYHTCYLTVSVVTPETRLDMVFPTFGITSRSFNFLNFVDFYIRMLNLY